MQITCPSCDSNIELPKITVAFQCLGFKCSGMTSTSRFYKHKPFGDESSVYVLSSGEAPQEEVGEYYTGYLETSGKDKTKVSINE